MDNSKYDFWLKLGKFFIGTVVLGTVSIIINYQIQKREVNIKEMEMLGKFIEHAIDGNVAVRYRFADYFATVSQSPDVRVRWEKYKIKIDEEFNRLDSVSAQLQKEKEKEMEINATLQDKYLAAKKEIENLKNELEYKNNSPEKKVLEKQIDAKQSTLNQIWSEKMVRDDKLAVVQNKLEETKKEITYPTQMVQQIAPKSGWVYLGEFDKEKKLWISKYWDFSLTTDPKSLVGKPISVSSGAVNVRSNGDPWSKVLESLKQNSLVQVELVQPWESSSYYWAQITYN